MHPFKLSSQRGFSLVELMIVVAIIGVLAALAVPRFQNFQAKAKQAEAKNNLSHIYTLEQSYFGDQDQFVGFASCGFAAACTNTTIGFQTTGKTRYNYSVGGASTTAFLATATAGTANVIKSGCAGGMDTWTMNEQKALNPVHDCTNF